MFAAEESAVLIRIEAFGRMLHVEWDRTHPEPEQPTDEPTDEPPVHLMTPMEVRSDDRHEWARDFTGFVARANANARFD